MTRCPQDRVNSTRSHGVKHEPRFHSAHRWAVPHLHHKRKQNRVNSGHQWSGQNSPPRAVLSKPAGRRSSPSNVRNGATGTVVGLQKQGSMATEQITVTFEQIGTVTLPRSFFDEHRFPQSGRVDVGLDHAYAVTSYSVQGATHEASTSRLDERATRAEVYVDITRGRSSNHVYLSRASDPLEDEALPKAPSPALDEAVSARLQRSGPELTAVEIDPHALGRAQAQGREPISR